jgi:hypothetical protein
MRRVLHILLSAVTIISLGIACEWLLLTGSSPQSVVSALTRRPATPAPAPAVAYQRPDFQTGVVFPRWGATAYSGADRNWGIGMGEIQQQTAAHWLEITVDLYDAGLSVPRVTPDPVTPSPLSVLAGIRAARARGFHVFVAPELTVGRGYWAGDIHFDDPDQTSAWFQSYWMALEPYVAAAAAGGADEFAIGTEYFRLERADPALWDALIAQVHGIFPGALTYNMNFTSIDLPVRDWMLNPLLTYVGVSEYQPLVSTSQRLEPRAIPALWRAQIGADLDGLAARLGKPVLISEIGYRANADTFYMPWHPTSAAARDPAEQAAAYDAALVSVLDDPNIAGIYFWAWSVPGYEPNWSPAAQVLHTWYTSPLA